MWDPGVSACFEHGRTELDHDLATIWIGDTDHLTPLCVLLPHRAGHQCESNTARKSSQQDVARAFQDSPLRRIRGMHKMYPLLDPAFLLAQPRYLPPSLGKAQQGENG